MRRQAPVVEQQFAHLRGASRVKPWARGVDGSEPLGRLGCLLGLVLGSTALVHPHAQAVHARAQVLYLRVEVVQVRLLPPLGHEPQGAHDAGSDRHVRRAVLMQVHVGLRGDARVVRLPCGHVEEHGCDEAQPVPVLGGPELVEEQRVEQGLGRDAKVLLDDRAVEVPGVVSDLEPGLVGEDLAEQPLVEVLVLGAVQPRLPVDGQKPYHEDLVLCADADAPQPRRQALDGVRLDIVGERLTLVLEEPLGRELRRGLVVDFRVLPIQRVTVPAHELAHVHVEDLAQLGLHLKQTRVVRGQHLELASSSRAPAHGIERRVAV